MAKRDHAKRMQAMREWSDDELRMLDKAVKKFPLGTPKRWEQVCGLCPCVSCVCHTHTHAVRRVLQRSSSVPHPQHPPLSHATMSPSHLVRHTHRHVHCHARWHTPDDTHARAMTPPGGGLRPHAHAG
jgi:hypothetical protein